MINFNKPLKIGLSILLLASAGMFALLVLGGDVPNQTLKTPVYTSTFINWTIFLIFLSAGITVLFEVFKIIKNPKNTYRTLISLGILLVILVIAYFLADDTPLKMYGYTGTDNVPNMLKLADIFIFTLYLIFGISILLLLYTEFSRIFRKK